MNFTTIFSTPIWQSEYPEFLDKKDSIVSSIKYLLNKDLEGRNDGNLFGYESNKNIHNECVEIHPVLQHVGELVVDISEEMNFIPIDIAFTSVWFNVIDSKQSMILPRTGSNTFSGIICLKSSEKSGKITFLNPTLNRMWEGLNLVEKRNQYTGEKIRISPVEGNILLFPSYVPYMMESNDSDEESIFISFNVTCLPQGSLTSQNTNES